MKNRTVKQYIILGFAAVILIMAALSGFAFVLFYEIRAKVADINSETLPGLYLSSQIESLSMDIVGTVYKHALSSDASEKKQHESEIAANQTRLETVSRDYEKTISTAGDRQLFASIADARSACEAAYTPVLELSRNAQINDVRASLRSQVDPACKVLRKSTQAEFEDNKRLGEEASRGILDAVSRAELGVVIALAIGIILAGASGYMLIRSVNRLVGQVQESGLKVSTSSAEIAATSQEQLSTANEIAATTSEIGATAKQISVTSRELVQTMKSVAEVAERTTALAGSGQLGLGRMKITVQQIVEASGSITDRLAVLNEKAGNIGTVVTTITKVADQTNLLSLNAAIEAEKAGEYGRGFAGGDGDSPIGGKVHRRGRRTPLDKARDEWRFVVNTHWGRHLTSALAMRPSHHMDWFELGQLGSGIVNSRARTSPSEPEKIKSIYLPVSLDLADLRFVVSLRSKTDFWNSLNKLEEARDFGDETQKLAEWLRHIEYVANELAAYWEGLGKKYQRTLHDVWRIPFTVLSGIGLVGIAFARYVNAIDTNQAAFLGTLAGIGGSSCYFAIDAAFGKKKLRKPKLKAFVDDAQKLDGNS